MPSKFRRTDPLHALIRELRTAARQIECAKSREIAAREADKIPLTLCERAHGSRGKMARLGRQQMRALPTMDPSGYVDAASVMRGVADAIDSRFEVTSEIHLGRKPRSGNVAA